MIKIWGKLILMMLSLTGEKQVPRQELKWDEAH